MESSNNVDSGFGGNGGLGKFDCRGKGTVVIVDAVNLSVFVLLVGVKFCGIDLKR